INLATAQAVNRSKEVGVRKVLGSLRRQLMAQFLMETALITFIAILASIGLAFAFLPLLNLLLEVQMSMDFIHNPALILFLIVTGLVVTLFSGLYPSFVLSGFRP